MIPNYSCNCLGKLHEIQNDKQLNFIKNVENYKNNCWITKKSKDSNLHLTISIRNENCKYENYMFIYEIDYHEKKLLYGKFCGNLKFLKINTKNNILIELPKFSRTNFAVYSSESFHEHNSSLYFLYFIYGVIFLLSLIIFSFATYLCIHRIRNVRKKNNLRIPLFKGPPKYEEIKF